LIIIPSGKLLLRLINVCLLDIIFGRLMILNTVKYVLKIYNSTSYIWHYKIYNLKPGPERGGGEVGGLSLGV